ncbi:MAG: baseplate J/gp47 family protein [Lachnospiraceae bacterium]|nr:baseplate J/gp47 family protein [Lachnospiraceae bacterium]
MLRIEETQGRTFEERMADSIAAIPLLTSEWTNHNPSDPGITILENLVLFEALQGSQITDINDETKRALLKMAGFTPAKGKCARMLLSAGEGARIHLNANQRFSLGDMVFETRKAMDVGGCHLKSIYSFHDGAYHDCGILLDRTYGVPVSAFGNSPKAGDGMYFICDSLPDAGEETSFYVEIDKRAERNEIKDRSDNIFASFKWECYTEEGFREIKARDFTGALLASGEIKLKFPDAHYAVYKGLPEEGYCIRAVLTKAEYDIKPRLLTVDAFLFEVWQKDTMALSVISQHPDRVQVRSPLADEGYILCFAREGRGGSYKRYELANTKDLNGRYCLYERGEKGRFTLTFDKRIYGFEPAKVKDAVRLTLYTEEVMRKYHVGSVLGYDGQEIDIPFEHIVPESFTLIAKRIKDDGEEIFDFVRPGKGSDGALIFHLIEGAGRIVIEDAGDFIGAELYIGSLAVTEGPKGNIRAGNIFKAEGLNRSFYNPGPGTGGAFREKTEDVRNRFREDVYTSYTCVTAPDYEAVVARTPGLCIKKVHAVMDELQNVVHISVMPGTDDGFPKLTPEYRNAISKTLSERRLITTRFMILPPVYVGVSVRTTVYVKRHFTDSREQIEQRIRRIVNYLESEKNFGETLTFEEVFSGIEDLPCVEYVYELFMRPDSLKAAALKEGDIHPGENCLLYPGRIDVEVITYSK